MLLGSVESELWRSAGKTVARIWKYIQDANEHRGKMESETQKLVLLVEQKRKRGDAVEVQRKALTKYCAACSYWEEREIGKREVHV